ncbi:transcriptional regulator [Gordonia sp. TBRC 11910]|uniref:Transcriptional regulator n=1 Tax=Gordonia asplenii TaxID=2725283 RepID=A0A848L3C1_9ACTN|nr:helix-turn-helix domain-containing protein [Gordonia asplenii]NMO03071.1 transcriptional regulator [Gordonia asplenii]
MDDVLTRPAIEVRRAPAPSVRDVAIGAAWTRSRLNRVDESVLPTPCESFDAASSRLLRAARPVLNRAAQDLADTQLGLVLADHDARVLHTRFEEKRLRDGLGELGIVPGTRLGEDVVGANAIGTPLEIRRGLLMYGADHYMTAFRDFTCYGHPIVNPVTKRVEGVMNIGGISEQHGLFGVVVKQLVADIEARLAESAADSHRRLVATFHAASGRGRRRPVVLVADNLVLATPAALDLLDTADHAVLRAVADEVRSTSRPAGRDVEQRVTLASGRSLDLRCTAVDDADAVLVDLITSPESSGALAAGRQLDTPLLVVGETGSGRKTFARRQAGADAATIDAADVAWHGEQAWCTAIRDMLAASAPGLIVENVHLLPPLVTAAVAKALATSERRVVLTASGSDRLADDIAPILAQCVAREDLVPLRNRPHEIPHLAQQMLAQIASSNTSRLTAETLRVLSAQRWPGNLTELRRVIEGLVRVRSVGDIIPADLPPSHRQVAVPNSPVQQAERELISAAIDAAGGNKVRAARALGVSRSTLYNKMRALAMA